ncbi:hypothetical protein CHS0354_034038 [Potamilus streckersoni]|uniref:Uncharacterized protein n=1 Tax=Potamilus streckersoni TaxID=2493646 RepID=A0AAE0T241_9BIVA|nr:hypothetical protein CHS0354_034038 [Potamilus streckersoni]
MGHTMQLVGAMDSWCLQGRCANNSKYYSSLSLRTSILGNGYVDDTLTELNGYQVHKFSDDLSFFDPHIQFIPEQEENGKLPFKDTCKHVNEE